MQRREGALAAWRCIFASILLISLLFAGAAFASAQVNTATLSGAVLDPQNLAVKGAKVTLTNAATAATRTAVTDDSGRYDLVALPPGRDKMTVDGDAKFPAYQKRAIPPTVEAAA